LVEKIFSVCLPSSMVSKQKRNNIIRRTELVALKLMPQ
jgi:hypothetical protein